MGYVPPMMALGAEPAPLSPFEVARRKAHRIGAPFLYADSSIDQAVWAKAVAELFSDVPPPVGLYDSPPVVYHPDWSNLWRRRR